MPYSFNHASVKGASKEATYSKILVLCIDRDDDIGSKGGIETPIVGMMHASMLALGLHLRIRRMQTRMPFLAQSRHTRSL